MFFVVYVETSELVRKNRMKNRGDDDKTILKRIENDAVVFKKR